MRWPPAETTSLILTLVITVAAVIAIQTQQLAYSSTIEVPTYDPPMTANAEINGTKTLDYFGNVDQAFEMIPWYNYTVMLDISDYNDCFAKGNDKLQSGVESLTLLTNNLTESERVISLSPDEQKAYLLDHCLAVLHISNVMEKALGDAFSRMG